MTRRRRLFVIMLGLLATLVVGSAIGLHFAARIIRDRVLEALGPQARIGRLELHRSSVEILDLRIIAPPGWPAGDALRARRVVVEPDLRALLSGEIRVGSILAEDPYLSVLRTRSGRIRLLPSLLERPGSPAAAQSAPEASSVPLTTIENVRVTGAAVDFYDASLRRKLHRIRIEGMEADLGPFLLPALTGRTSIDIAGTVKGQRKDGHFSLKGWMEVASRDSELRLQLAGVDLSSVEPYLLRTAEMGSARGTLDLDLRSQVLHKRLKAPGTLTLNNLVLNGGSFMGMSRVAVADALKNQNGQVRVDFTLEGSLDDPHFSLNEAFALKVAAATAEGLGVSLGGVVKSLGGGSAEGLGEALEKLFGK